MKLKTVIEHRTLHFHQPADTSRGVYRTHDVWYVRVSSLKHPELIGIGECAPLPDLSCDYGDDYPVRLQEACLKLELEGVLDTEALRSQPSILFGLETAMRQLTVLIERDKQLQENERQQQEKERHLQDNTRHRPQTNAFALWDTPFSRGEQGIPINGLIWMNSYREMEAQIREKLDKGFRCIKLKIGALNFEEELALLKQIRKEYFPETLTLRVDANGAFSPQEAPEKLKRLSELDLHSIEQPIRAGQWEALQALIETSPIPIALDEELIGVFSLEQKTELLDALVPKKRLQNFFFSDNPLSNKPFHQAPSTTSLLPDCTLPLFLVLKPTLHGGISGCSEWIRLAEARGIGWWITSALESNIGLNAVAQWCATLDNPLHQGLGTGLLYSDNVEMPLVIEGEKLWFRP